MPKEGGEEPDRTRKNLKDIPFKSFTACKDSACCFLRRKCVMVPIRWSRTLLLGFWYSSYNQLIMERGTRQPPMDILNKMVENKSMTNNRSILRNRRHSIPTVIGKGDLRRGNAYLNLCN